MIVRVDNVVFRTYDTRVFHAFTEGEPSAPHIVRETSGWEAPYDVVKAVCDIFI